MTVRIVVKKPGIIHSPEICEVEDDLASYQGIVEGRIECVYVPELHEKGIDLWVNEEGKFLLPANFLIFDGQDSVHGTVFFASFNDVGDIVGLTANQIQEVRRFLGSVPVSIFG